MRPAGKTGRSFESGVESGCIFLHECYHQERPAAFLVFIERPRITEDFRMKRVIFFGLLAIVSTALLDAQTGVLPGPTPTPTAAPTGFYGQSLVFYSVGAFQPPQEGIPYRTYLSVYDSDGKLLKRLVSNPAGQFYSPMKPGSYVL